MGRSAPASTNAQPAEIKQVPRDGTVRDAVRELAAMSVKDMDKTRPPLREELERQALVILDRLSLPEKYLGFTMVAISNAFWRPQFEGVSFDRRLLFLPNCLRDRDACQGEFDSRGLLNCVGCRDCVVRHMKETAEARGYRVLIFEGTPPVLSELTECSADAILGVACLDSLDKAFDTANQMGVPSVAVPLLRDGCANTAVETDLVRSYLRAAGPVSPTKSRTYVPLLRESVRIFAPDSLAQLLSDCVSASDRMSTTESVALEWIGAGGKRFRPFVTLAAYAAGKHGKDVFSADADLGGLIPPSVRRIAVAIEILHKASLVHDDIEDGDGFRYGRETIHRTHGTGPAINVGDFLVGLGYRLISKQAETLGAGCVADILAQLSAAHLDLCRGQGAELLWRNNGSALKPVDALSAYALKTAPAFEAALYAGLRAADADVDKGVIKKFSVYLGEAYQVLNDLQDWREHKGNKVVSGRDVAVEHPTLLRAFALEVGAKRRLTGANGDADKIRSIYEELGVFEKAEALVEKLRSRAIALAESLEDPALKDLLLFIVRTVV